MPHSQPIDLKRVLELVGLGYFVRANDILKQIQTTTASERYAFVISLPEMWIGLDAEELRRLNIPVFKSFSPATKGEEKGSARKLRDWFDDNAVGRKDSQAMQVVRSRFGGSFEDIIKYDFLAGRGKEVKKLSMKKVE